MSSGGGSGGNDFAFFLGILLVIFAVWIGSGGPNHPISFTGPFLSPRVPGISTSSPNYIPSIGRADIPGEASEHRGAVTLSRDITGPMNDDPRSEYVVIQRLSLASGSVSLAGWRLVSTETNVSVPIPQGVALPSAGRVNPAGPVMLAPGEEAIIVSGRSPIGISFKENLCTGYFEQHQDFMPSLSLSCPTPTQEFNRTYDANDNDECIAFVRGIPYCTALTRTPSELSSQCETFIERELTYDGCAAAHRSSENFSGHTWRLYLNQSDDLWKRDRETILLVDAQGKTVDALSY